MTAKMISEMKLHIYDPGFKMLNSNYFLIGRRIAFVLPDTLEVEDSDGDDVLFQSRRLILKLLRYPQNMERTIL